MTKDATGGPLSFQTRIVLGGKTATGFEIPEDVVTALGAGRRPAVRVTVNGHTYRSTVAVMGGAHMLPLSAENRAAAGVAAGDEVRVEVSLDTEPREITVPDDLATALAADRAAKEFFDGLSYSNKRGFVQQIEGAKAEDTRARRVAKAIATLHAGKPRM